MNRAEWPLFLAACGIKLLLAVLVHPGSTGGTGRWAVRGGDTFSYLDPVENLLHVGTYAQDLARLETYAGRMPGYGAVYGVLRLGLPPGPAADALVLLQLALSLYALYCLGRLAQAATGRRAAFGWAVGLFAANTFTTVLDIRLLSESFAISALVAGLHAAWRAQRQPTAGRLLAAGAWLGWLVFLRPFMLPVLGLVAAWVAGRALGARGAGGVLPGVGRAARPALLVLLPFAVADAAWVARNWRWYGAAVPLQSNTWAGYRNPPGLLALNDFMGTLGQEHAWWHAGSDMAWFYGPPGRPGPNFRHEPQKLAPPAYTYDSLLRVRQLLALARDSTRPAAVREAATARATRALGTYARAYRRLRPVRAGVVAPLRLAYGLVLAHPGDYLFRRPFAELPPALRALKVLVHAWYWLLVGLGWAGTLALGWRRQFAALAAKAVPLLVVAVFCVGVRLVDARYFALAYPLVLIGTVLVLLRTGAAWRRWRAARV